MIHLHWYTAVVVAALVFCFGMLAVAIIKVELDRLELAADYQDKAIEALRDELTEKEAELVILRAGIGGTGIPTEAA